MKQVHDKDGNALPTDPHMAPMTKDAPDLALADDAVKLPAHPLDPEAD